MIIHWKADEQCFTEELFDFQFHPVCNFGKFITFGLGTVGSERLRKRRIVTAQMYLKRRRATCSVVELITLPKNTLLVSVQMKTLNNIYSAELLSCLTPLI